MKNDKRVLLKVGLTVIISILIVLFGIAFLKDLKFGIETNDLIVYFSDVNGLKEGDPVSVNGVPKGKVKKIDLTTGDSVKVEFFLSKDVTLKKDYNIAVGMMELMSGKQVALKPGISTELADITKPLVGAKNTDVVTLIETMNKVGDQVQSITNKLDKTMDGLDKAVTNINDIVGDEGLKSNIRGTASNFNVASHNLNIMLADTRNNINSLTLKLNKIAENVDNTVSDTKPELKETLEDIRSLTARVDTLAINLNSLVLNAKDTNSTIGKLTGDDEIYNNLNKTIISINKLIRKIEKDGIKLNLF
jgi:phospholipid/cholesterol/gamma-HCH transport system substrate-binding protein